MRVAWCLVFFVLVASSCATTSSSAPSQASKAAQTVADLDRAAQSTLAVSESTRAELREDQGKAADAWLREALREVSGTADSDLAQTQQIIAEADRRGRAAVAAEAEAVEGRILAQRSGELDALVASGRWLQALEQAGAWSAHARPSSAAQALRDRTAAQVKQRILEGQARATSPAEEFLYRRMRLWLGEPQPGGALPLQPLTTTLASLDFGSSGCEQARSVTVPSVQGGTSAVVLVTLGSCEVQARRGRESREAGYTVAVMRQRQEAYTENITSTQQVTESKQECGQVEKTFYTNSAGKAETGIVSECHQVPSTRTIEVQTPVTRTRMVMVEEQEPHTESFSVDTVDLDVGLQVSVSVSGDGEALSVSDRLTATSHDEQYARQHGQSRSFGSDGELNLKRGLSQPVQALVDRALAQWAQARGRARIKAAHTGGPAARGLAVEAVALDGALAQSAAEVLGLPLAPAALVALVSGTPTVERAALAAGAGLALPAPSASVESEYARLEERQKQVIASHSDVFLGVGAGLQPTPDHKASGAMSIEIQYGYVPEFAAVGHLVARVEADLQVLATVFALGDLAARPEFGFRLGPLQLSAVGIGGGRLANEQTVPDSEDNTHVAFSYYAGYGAHLTLHLGPVLLDAMALRLHQRGAHSPIAVRGDAIVGFALSEVVFLVLRCRYLAQTDVREAFKTPDRVASLVLATMLQF